MFDNLDEVIDDYPRKYYIYFEIINKTQNLSFIASHPIKIYEEGGGVIEDIDEFLSKINISIMFQHWEKTDECTIIKKTSDLADFIKEEDIDTINWICTDFITVLKKCLKQIDGYNFDYKEEGKNNDQRR